MSEYNIFKQIPAVAYKGQSFEFWSNILKNMIDELMYKTRCSRDSIKIILNQVAYQEILYRIKTCMYYYPTEIEVNFDHYSNPSISGKIMGIDFEVTNNEIVSIPDTATIRMRTYESWDDCIRYNGYDHINSYIRGSSIDRNEYYEEKKKRELFADLRMTLDRRNNMKIKIKKVIFNGPATIVFWSDNTKTIVKCMPEETFDREKGILAAWYKKLYGDKPNYFKDIKKWARTDNKE